MDADAAAPQGRRAWHPSAPLERTAFAAAHALASAGTNTAHGGSRVHSDIYACRSAATPAGGCRSAAGQREALAARRPRRPSTARAEDATPYPTSPFYQAIWSLVGARESRHAFGRDLCPYSKLTVPNTPAPKYTEVPCEFRIDLGQQTIEFFPDRMDSEIEVRRSIGAGSRSMAGFGCPPRVPRQSSSGLSLRKTELHLGQQTTQIFSSGHPWTFDGLRR